VAPIDAPPVAAAPITPAAPAPVEPAKTVAPVTPSAPSAGEKHAASPAAAKPSGPPGFITIDSEPVYATIYIDGKNYGETPLFKVSLSPGRHNVRAVAPSGASRDVRITIESGKTAPASRIQW
jgi:hypothetical protein